MTPQPHPQRCETCTHLKKHEIHNLYCEISGRKTPHGTLFMERVAELGCASHSSHPHTPAAPAAPIAAKTITCTHHLTEAEKVVIRNQTLDDIDKAIIEQIDCHDCRIALVRIINSFRQSTSTTGGAPR